MDAGLAQLIAGLILAVATIISPLITVYLTQSHGAGATDTKRPSSPSSPESSPVDAIWPMLVWGAVGAVLGVVAGYAVFSVVFLLYLMFGPLTMDPALAGLDAGITSAAAFATSMLLSMTARGKIAVIANSSGYLVMVCLAAISCGFLAALMGNVVWALALGVATEDQHLMLDSTDAGIACGLTSLLAVVGVRKFLSLTASGSRQN